MERKEIKISRKDLLKYEYDTIKTIKDIHTHIIKLIDRNKYLDLYELLFLINTHNIEGDIFHNLYMHTIQNIPALSIFNIDGENIKSNELIKRVQSNLIKRYKLYSNKDKNGNIRLEGKIRAFVFHLDKFIIRSNIYDDIFLMYNIGLSSIFDNDISIEESISNALSLYQEKLIEFIVEIKDILVERESILSKVADDILDEIENIENEDWNNIDLIGLDTIEY